MTPKSTGQKGRNGMKIGFIGLGIMGESMSENIVKKHDGEVFVYDMVHAQVEKLEALGATGCGSSPEVARNADVIITMVPKSEHSKSVYREILGELGEGKTCIDMSTIDPGVSVEIAGMVEATGARFLDAPVVKSKPAAIAGTLGIYVGGDREVYEKMKGILLYMGNNTIHMGDHGKGLVMKVCHNTLVAQIQNGVNETIALAEQNGIGLDAYTEAVSYGGGQNFYLDGKAPFIKDNNFTTAFSVENMAKDLGICRTMATEEGIRMPGMEVSLEVYKDALDMGLGRMDFCATIQAVRKRMA
ncbi:NAD(P)-dependent oxidoreductase [Anaerotalea alkaliphila]|uniref:NAD(P)-dependent oxidoreductase n=1 Tax=Anaerotalea alkaliphila TaxID=2662126 RepID=A0A7X5HUR0_9FIRM|nr:NAD(P)-dependent oxidoreductase [Anaerotalea alkaliphila]NDL67013.1 NAD(P)-dependent oxidoreductase [Anaerotalea alkaliphila]